MLTYVVVLCCVCRAPSVMHRPPPPLPGEGHISVDALFEDPGKCIVWRASEMLGVLFFTSRVLTHIWKTAHIGFLVVCDKQHLIPFLGLLLGGASPAAASR